MIATVIALAVWQIMCWDEVAPIALNTTKLYTDGIGLFVDLVAAGATALEEALEEA